MTKPLVSHPRFLLGATLVAAIVASCQPSSRTVPPAPTPTSATTPSPGLPADLARLVQSADESVRQRWTALGVTPSPEVDDATFLRRVTLDLTGQLPRPEGITAFLADGGPDKRQRALARLLASDDFARHFTNVFDDLLMEGARSPLVDRPTFRKWLYNALKGGRGYDAIVGELVAGTGANTAARRDLSGWDLRGDTALPDGVNGAVNWPLRYARQPQDLAGATARLFLGVQIQCAECHDHPSEKWTQGDFKRFTAAFMRTTARRHGKKMKGLRAVTLEDRARPSRRMARRMEKTGYTDASPTALDGSSLDGDNPRRALATWITADDNRWFARATVNRMWAYFLGRGFFEPVDDFRSDQPVESEAVLAALARDFVNHAYDLRRLSRAIVSTAAYQRSAAGKDTPQAWHRFALRPMTDTQLLDALVVATDVGPVLTDVLGDRVERLKLRLRKQFRFTFDVDEDTSDDTFTGTIPQALMLLNGPLSAAGSSALQGSTVGQALGDDDDRAGITRLYLSALSRPPTEGELKHWLTYLKQAQRERWSHGQNPRGGGPVGRLYRRKRLRGTGARAEAYEDVFWALLNSDEFYFIH